MDKRIIRLRDRLYEAAGIQTAIAVSFTLIFSLVIVLLSLVLYSQFSARSRGMNIDSTERFLNQTRTSLEDYLRSMRRFSDAMYYTSIKNSDLDESGLYSELNLMYEANKDDLISFAIFSDDGTLISAVPVSVRKEGADPSSQEWFQAAMEEVENLHFSVPHVQNLFEETAGQYHWVISLSRSIQLTRGGVPGMGVLLVDMNFSRIAQMLARANEDSSYQYIYLCDRDGSIIYHPRQRLIEEGLFREDALAAASRPDGTYENIGSGQGQITVVKTVSYTGWKLISVIPEAGWQLGMGRFRYLVILLISLTLIGVIGITQLVSRQISRPLLQLNESVRDLESGNLYPEIYIGGSREVRHLGQTVEASVRRIRALMQDLVVQQELKRQSELDALQSQINPHFLYNTLDSVVWMIEGGHDQEAVRMIGDLASLLRISISQGRTIIPVADEIRHARAYMEIQKIRYRNTFEVDFEVSPEVESMATVKLIIQPILENAIYYGVREMDGEGEIRVRAYLEGGDVWIDVEDNGIGIPEDQAKRLLTERSRELVHGNGVGLLNVHSRIRLRFGQDYGLVIESEPDEGTRVRIHLPAIPYRETLEAELSSGAGKEGADGEQG